MNVLCLLCTRRLILSVRDTCVDWMRGVEPHDDPAMKGKKDPDEGFTIKVPRRNVGPSTTQVICLSFDDIVILYLGMWCNMNIYESE